MYLYQPVTVSMRHPFSLGVLSQFPRRVCCRALLMATALLSFAPCVATALTCILSLVENPGRGGAVAGWLLICLLVDLRDLSWWDLVYLVDWWLILLVVWILGYCFVKVLRFDLCSSTLLIALGLASELRGQSISVDPAEWISESGVYKVRGLMRGALLTSAGVSCYQHVFRSAPHDLRFDDVAGGLFTMHIHTWFHIQFYSYTYLFFHIWGCFGCSGLFNSHTYLFLIFLRFGLVWLFL